MPDLIDAYMATLAGQDKRSVAILMELGMSSVDAQRLVELFGFNPQMSWAELRKEMMSFNIFPKGFDPLPFGIGTVSKTPEVKRSI